jgi:hypothetical protein
MSLVEIIVGSALFAVLAIGVYQSYATLTSLVSASRVKIVATDLLNERLELIRNLSYDSVGIVGGIPSGALERTETFVRDNRTFIATTTIRNIDDPFDGTIGGSPNDLSPADYKSIDIDLACPSCKNFPPMSVSARLAPKNLETASTNGALFIRVFDANGVPVSGASVHIENLSANPAISIDELTNNNGVLQIVDAPPGAQAYAISVTKAGYTTDGTAATTVDNPNPIKPHATVALQQVTQVSFVIDRTSTMLLSAVTNSCANISSATVTMRGTKMLGSSPDIYKYEEDHALGGGTVSIPNLEWDTYSLSLSGGGYFLGGVNPLLPVTLLPDAEQDVQLTVVPNNPSVLLVTVKDSATNLPLSGASVEISGPGGDESGVTGRGFLGQTDWSGGSGQDLIGNETEYFSSDGNISTNNPEGAITLQSIFGVFAPSGVLTSSTFDTGTTSNFSQISFSPGSQPVEVGDDSVRFQVAGNNDMVTWNYIGPDGTASSYYDSTNTNIHSSMNGNRYFRYRVFLQTDDTGATPIVSDVALTFTSECIPPGQTVFTNLTTGSYTVSVTKSGYSDSVTTAPVDNAWQEAQVILLSE